MTHILLLISCAILFTNCQKDIKKSDIGTTSILIKSDSCFAFLPNAFTPDANGTNDLLRPLYKGTTGNSFTFRIRNKKQKVVFTTSTFGDFWDGHYNGAEQAQGEYIATLSGRTSCGNRYERHTCVHLYRDCISGDINKMEFEDMLDPITGSLLFATGETSCP